MWHCSFKNNYKRLSKHYTIFYFWVNIIMFINITVTLFLSLVWPWQRDRQKRYINYLSFKERIEDSFIVKLMWMRNPGLNFSGGFNWGHKIDKTRPCLNWWLRNFSSGTCISSWELNTVYNNSIKNMINVSNLNIKDWF